IGHTKASIDCNVNALTAEVKMIVGERQYLRRDGTLLVAEVHAQIIRHKGGQAFCVAVHDVTERRQAEAAQFAAERDYQSLFENASEGIFRTTLDGKYLQANPALARIYGYETPAILIREMTDINTSLYVDAEKRQQFQRLIKEQGRAADFEAQLYRQDGTIIWISESARPVYDAGGELLWYEGFVQDITERKAREDQQAQRLAEAVKRADRDPLTGLLNHRAFQKKLEQETDRMQRQGASLVVAILDLDNFKFFNDAYGHAAGDEVLRQVAEALRQQCRSYDTLSRFGGDEFGLLLPGAYEAEQLAAGLKERLARIGYCPPGYDTPIPIGASIGLAVFPNEAATRTEVLALADERLRRVKSGVGEAEDLIAGLRARLPVSAIEGFEMLTALVTAVDTKDRYTRRHSEDVLSYSLQIAVGLGLSEETRQTIAVAALLHDVGKIGVPDAILRKPGRLTDAEFKAIQQHPVMGAAIVGAVAGFEETLDAVRHHHERWDGGGYPSGLRGEKTPLIARVMAVADAFSAMTTDRPYRNSMTDAKALSILNEGAGSQWDPACVEAFLRSRISRRGILNRSI
ncbi:MAG: sensor domain-containing diguanylate cyclase/phosphohydrolase, partial [Janthinobacterium lividum]